MALAPAGFPLDKVDFMQGTERVPQSAHQLVIGTFRLYRRYPLLFLVLAAGVIVPYELIVLAVTGSGPLGQGSLSPGADALVTLADWTLVTPLISALHVHAVGEAREGGTPRLAPIARQGLKVLPVVAAASVVSSLGITVGFVALIVPGIFLLLRWFVVAQAAAIEHEGWLPALRRSGELTDDRYGHIFVFAVYLGLIVSLPVFLIGLGLGDDSSGAALVARLLVQVVAWSFGALATALLYYDLRVRREYALASGLPGTGPPPTSHSWDPRNYSSQDRPKGWYVDPRSPNRMRYWDAADPPDWSIATARTPRKIRRAWKEAS
jgi:hypothetical protein